MALKKYKKILIVRTDRIGDVVLTTPVVKTLREHFFDTYITMLVSSSTKDLIAGLEGLDNILVDDRDGRHQGVFGFWRLVNDIKKERFDLVFIFHTKKRTNLACALAGIPERIGYKNEKYGFLLTKQLEDSRHLGRKHEVEYCLDVLEAIGIKEKGVSLSLPINSQAVRVLKDWLVKEGIVNQQLVVLHPGSSCPTKCWPVKLFGELAKALGEYRHVSVVVVGDGSCRDAARQIKRYAGNHVIDVSGNLSLPVLTALFKESAVIVSNDSGPVHIAAAVRTPVISLFLRNQPGINPTRWRPYAENAITLMNKPGEEIVLDNRGNVISGNFESIKVNEVLSHVIKFIKEAGNVS